MNDLQIELWLTVHHYGLEHMPMTSSRIDVILRVLQELMPRG